jgi:predicted Zn finger-like uncharacterized protein
MIITCENCSTQFTLDDALIKPQGSKVRCSQCQHIFTAMPPQPEELEPAFEMEEELDFDIDDPGSEEPVFDPPLPEAEEDTAAEAPEIQTEMADQDMENLDMDFEDVDFDDELDFDEADLDFDSSDLEMEEEAMDEPEPDKETDAGDAEEITFEENSPEFDFEEDLTEDPPQDDPEPEGLLEMEESSGQKTDPSNESDEFPELEMDDSEDEAGIAEIEFEDLVLEEDDVPATEETTDIEISFDQDDQPALEVETDIIDEVDFDEQDLTFDEDDIEFEAAPPGSVEPEDAEELDKMDFESLDAMEEAVESEADIELSFDDEDEIPDLEFDEPQPESDIEMEATGEEPFPEIEEFSPEGPETGLDLELDPSDQEEPENLAFDTDSIDLESPAEDQKFAEYDQVLEQDTEPETDFPELDEELNEPADAPGDPINPEEALEENDTAGIAPPTEPAEESPAPSPLIDPGITDEIPPGKKKKGIGAPVKILLLLFLLVIAAYLISLRLGINIPMLSQINIPFVTQAFKKAPAPQPVLKPAPNEASVKGYFATNETAGNLFIITGRIENPSTIAYSHIRVKGTLIAKDNAKASTQTIYCGNIIDDEVLKKGNISDIKKQLNIKEGILNKNVNIKPGSGVDFMLVFSNLPENLTNFTVEVMDFKPSGPQ